MRDNDERVIVAGVKRGGKLHVAAVSLAEASVSGAEESGGVESSEG